MGETECLYQKLRMFAVIWATLLFSVRGTNADPGGFIWKRQDCRNGFCVTLSEAEITAEAGLCVVIPCSFTGFGLTPQNMIWYKCEPVKQRCGDSDMIFHTNRKNVQSGFNGRVSLLDPDLGQGNCSIIICDLVESDSGSYQLGVDGFLFGSKFRFPFSPRTTVSVKGPVQLCGPHSAVLPWAVAGVSLSMNVVFTVYVIFLWKARKKKENQADRTYMSLQKKDRSPEYDVIGQPQT